jgi:hypothetical protein
MKYLTRLLTTTSTPSFSQSPVSSARWQRQLHKMPVQVNMLAQVLCSKTVSSGHADKEFTSSNHMTALHTLSMNGKSIEQHSAPVPKIPTRSCTDDSCRRSSNGSASLSLTMTCVDTSGRAHNI